MNNYTVEILRMYTTLEERQKFASFKAKSLFEKHNKGLLGSIPFSYWEEDYCLLSSFKEFGYLEKRDIEILEILTDSYKINFSTKNPNSKKLRNKSKIIDSIKKLSERAGCSYTLGCYNEDIEKVSLKELPRIIDALDYDASDVIVSIRRKIYVVEIFTLDNEIDLSIQDLDSYISQYGDNGILEKVEEYEKEKIKNNDLIKLYK